MCVSVRVSGRGWLAGWLAAILPHPLDTPPARSGFWRPPDLRAFALPAAAGSAMSRRGTHTLNLCFSSSSVDSGAWAVVCRRGRPRVCRRPPQPSTVLRASCSASNV